MTEASAPGGLRLASIDDYLGPSASRFFGAGYRNVRYRVRDAGFDSQNGLAATFEVGYPADWSKKRDGIDLRPHLSTIDALVLAVRAAESCVAATYGLAAGQRDSSWIRRVDIKAGTVPVEDELGAIAVTGRLTGTSDILEVPARRISTVDCSVAVMKARVTVEHETAGPAAQSTAVSAPALGELYPGPYGNGFRRHEHNIEDVIVDIAELSAEATVSMGGPAVPSMVDSFAVSLQLGQVLLYELDGVPRAGTDTLWMRTTSITASDPPRLGRAPVRAAVALTEQRVFQRGGETWRTATIAGDLMGLRTRCAVAHRLPD